MDNLRREDREKMKRNLEYARQILRNKKFGPVNVDDVRKEAQMGWEANVEKVRKEVENKLNSMKGGKKQVVTRKRYEDRTVEELRHQAATRKISGCHSMKKAELINSLRK